ncbi:MAG: hypothetical protein QXJ64_05995 [Thermosphaera sp.]
MVDLEAVVRGFVNGLDTELDFKLVKAKTSVSELVREIRNKREDSLLRQ